MSSLDSLILTFNVRRKPYKKWNSTKDSIYRYLRLFPELEQSLPRNASEGLIFRNQHANGCTLFDFSITRLDTGKNEVKTRTPEPLFPLWTPRPSLYIGVYVGADYEF